jgi:hypothetical protein
MTRSVAVQGRKGGSRRRYVHPIVVDNSWILPISIAIGLIAWRALAPRTHLALAAHIFLPGSWLACFTQAAT